MPTKRPISRKNWSADTLREELVADESTWAVHANNFVARVVEAHKGYLYVSPEPEPYQIDIKDVWLATIPKRFFLAMKSSRKLLAVGDRVLCEESGDKYEQIDLPTCRVFRVAPRRNRISRLDATNPNLLHTIASNVDNLLIVISVAEPTPNFALVDRYLVLAAQQGIRATIVCNKSDLLTPNLRAAITKRLDYYRALSYPVLLVQANCQQSLQQHDFQALQAILAAGIAVFTGQSGVGKSSLVNLFSPALMQSISERGSGQHTTTYATLLSLQAGGFIVDTPGVRRFALEKIADHKLGNCFREFDSYQSACRYRVCLHVNEPVCGVKTAVADGLISEARYNSYLTILRGTGCP
ncbi:MAG: ribosome small subunit-dependent GTPase A [Pseudomonadota bacterium]|nr:ribosome small subunit-dependent GTPase A [Pseudomonadota bacterium]